MKTPAHAGDAPYRVPRETSRWPSLALAAAMHAGLIFFLWVGVHWQSTEPVAVEAEVWDMKTQAAAPPPEPEVETAPPKPQPPAPTPTPAAAAPDEAPPTPKAPDIALERSKLKRARQAEEQQRQQLQELADKLAKNKADAKAEAKAEAKAKALADAKAEAKADAKAKALAEAKADKDAAEKKELADKKLADKLAKAKRAAEEQKQAAKVHEQEMQRITGVSGSGTSGTAAKSTAPRSDSGYQAAVTAKIKGNLIYNAGSDMDGDPRAQFKIEQLPTGEILSVRKIKSSGIPAYDSAVENAIHKSSPLPKKKDGTVDREVIAEFKLKDTP